MGKAIRRITAAKKERINKLTVILCDFLPLSSNSKNVVTFKSIFNESKIGKYLEGYDIKQQALENGLENLYRYHTKLPFTIIRKVVPAAIEYRRYKRKPLKQCELDELIKCLNDLDIDMSSELRKVNIDEQLPRITVPPEQLKGNLRQHDLDPCISYEPLDLFDNGHFNEAVRKAFEKFEKKVREVTGLEVIGRDLMAKAFLDETYIKVSHIKTENMKDFVDGYKLLAMGSMAAIRNIFSHGDEESRSPEECFEMLLLLNWMLRYLKFED